MDNFTFLYDVPPAVVERFSLIMDNGGDSLGWRGLAVRIASNQLEVRELERLQAAGRSPTRELLWSWAQQNTRVQDLCTVLQDMGHQRALQLFQSPARESTPPPLPSNNQPECKAEVRKDEEEKERESTRPEESPSGQRSSPAFTSENQSPSITLQDIKEGTRGFHHELRIADGHFSDFYRARIRNQTFAVKLFKKVDNVSWRKLWDVFTKEMELHHLYRHPNIIDMLGCFSDDDHYCLLYPYLPGGSLSHRLHHRDGVNPLSWQERLTIIKGVAKALHHLHTAQPCPVICGNISSANILLDDALQPKLSDFGLARLRPNSANQNCTITLNRSLLNNQGYLPEEYIRDHKLSFSLDVYSFGMVIMETITGRKVREDAPKQTLLRELLVTEVENSGGVDSCLQFLDKAAGQWPTALALSLLTLALDCTASRYRNRPNMENVLETLSQLLPPPTCPPADQPRSLDDRAALNGPESISPSIPVEHDEQLSLPGSLAQEEPCECSQSEVTYLSGSEATVDLYGSWPVQCSCDDEAGGLACEDCRANGFTPDPTQNPQTDFSGASSVVVENPVKERLRHKLSLYNRGLIHSGELFSETTL